MRLVETLKQGQYSPVPVEEQVVILYCATGTYLMDIPVEQVLSFNRALVDYVHGNYGQVLKDIAETGLLTAENEILLKQAIVELKGTF